MPHVFWLNRATGSALAVISSAARLSAQELLGYAASRCSCQSFLLGRTGSHTLQRVRLCLREGPLQATPQIFQTGFLVRRVQEPRSTAGKALMSGHGQIRWQDGHNSSSGDPSQADLHYAKLLGQTVPWTWFCRWAKLWVGTTPWAMHVGTRSPGCWNPLPPSASQSVSQWLNLTEFPAIRMGKSQIRGSHEATHNAGGGCMSSLGSLSPLREP